MKAAPDGVKPRISHFLMVLALTGCAGPKPENAFDPKLASSVNASASEAAVSKPGTKVCRWVQVGISERDLIRGVTQQPEPGQTVRVRIEDPGRFTNSLNGTQLARGAVVLDKAIAWMPCVF